MYRIDRSERYSQLAAGVIPGASAGFSSPAEESVRPSATRSTSTSDPSSGSLGGAFQFQAWRTSDLVESPQSFQANNVWRGHTACEVDPVTSIPAGENIAATQLQWRFAQLVNMPPVSPVVIVAYPRPSDDVSFAGAAVAGAAPIMPGADRRVDSSAGSVSFSYASLEALRRQLGETLTTLNTVMVSDARETITEEDSPAEVFGDSPRFRDNRLENILHQYREFSAIVEQELRLRMAPMQRPLPSATGESPADPPAADVSSGDEADGEVADSSALAGQRFGEQTTREQVQPPTGQEETPAIDTDDAARSLCEHYVRRCYVRFPCCNDYYACHRCHNDADKCGKKEINARSATHLRCAECLVEQEINEDSQHCSACSAKLADYFCSKCKHFAQQEITPYHCDKCGICRRHKERAFHCDLCNICLDKRLQGIHNCRAESRHDECGICLDSVFSGCEVLPCSHKLHRQCLILMIKNKHETCPICRYSIYAPHKQD